MTPNILLAVWVICTRDIIDHISKDNVRAENQINLLPFTVNVHSYEIFDCYTTQLQGLVTWNQRVAEDIVISIAEDGVISIFNLNLSSKINNC